MHDSLASESVRSYMALAEGRIGAAFAAERIFVHLSGAVQGPHTLTFALRSYEPNAANIARALRLAPAIEASIADGPVRVYAERGTVLIEVPSPWPSNVRGADLRGERLAVPLGLTSRQAIAGVDFDASPHLLVVGPTGRGKSTAMGALAFHLARQNRPAFVGMLAITLKPGDWQGFGRLAHSWAVISSPDEALAAFAWLRDELQRRSAAGPRLPHLFVFVDDLLNLLAVADVGGH